MLESLLQSYVIFTTVAYQFLRVFFKKDYLCKVGHIR